MRKLRFDTIVLGAGMVGVCVAAHLQARGRSVALVDIKQAGEETSFGNAGLIQREGVYPYAFPRQFDALMRYARNNALDVRYHPEMLIKLAPFLWRYWRNSHPDNHARIARSYATLIQHSVTEHRALARQANASALLKPSGWMRVFRTAKRYDTELQAVERWKREFGVAYTALDSPTLQRVEPNLDAALLGAIHYTDADACSDPGNLVKAYAQHFAALGGQFFLGDARSLAQRPDGWSVKIAAGQDNSGDSGDLPTPSAMQDAPAEITASAAVIALGPWADQLTRRLGYDFPLAVKRGYHMHYATAPQAHLDHPVLDAERGYLLAPMTRGIRLTTGIEFGPRDGKKTPLQLAAVEPIARTLFPLTDRLDPEPWMGRRPCTADMLPIIGPAPRHPGLWFSFGHAHHGLTLGAVTGRLVAEMMTGQATLVDPSPFRPERF